MPVDVEKLAEILSSYNEQFAAHATVVSLIIMTLPKEHRDLLIGALKGSAENKEASDEFHRLAEIIVKAVKTGEETFERGAEK